MFIFLTENRKFLNKDTFVCFIDLKKAFDSVNRDLLFYKLQLYGLNGQLLNNIMGLYKNVRYRVEINEEQTEYFEVKSGVKQGCILSPTLFNLFINDFIFYIKESNIGIPINNKIINILLYADDIVLIAENENDLAHLINRVNTWCNKNQMCLNTEN